jgi:hypothetical protein
MPFSISVGFADLGRGTYPDVQDPSLNGQPIFAHGSHYPHGLFAHAPSQIDYRLDGRYASFETWILLQDQVSCGDGVEFTLLLDDRIAYKSTPLSSQTKPIKVHLDVTGVRILTLSVQMRQSGDCDWAIWGDPILTLADPATQFQASQITPTIPPYMPCGDPMDARTYLFLNCADLHRIHQELLINPDTRQAWMNIQGRLSAFRADLPTAYSRDKSSGTLWWGNGNYIFLNMGLTYLLTGDELMGKDIVRLLYLVRDHTPSGLTMTSESHGEVLVQSIIFGYSIARLQGLLSPEEIAEFDRFFMRQAELYEAVAIKRGNRIPLESWLNRNTAIGANLSAATIALAYLEDPGMLNLFARVRANIEWQIGHYWEEDGGWGENSDSYGYRVMEGLLLFAETLKKKTGENIYQVDFNGRTLGLICNYFLKVLTPEGDYTAPNDSAYNALDPGIMVLCGNRTDDPYLYFAYERYLRGIHSAFGRDSSADEMLFEMVAWSGLANSPTLEPPYTSISLPASGLNILRENWTDQSQFLAVQFTQSQVHHEAAFGNIFLYDNGPWIVGNGYFLPDWSEQTGFPTDQHSTLSINDQNQESPGGSSIAFADLLSTAMTGVTHFSYDNFNHERKVFWVKPWHLWIVVDEGDVDEGVHAVQVRWYVRGEKLSSEGERWTFGRPENNEELHIFFLPKEIASYEEIARAYPAFQWIVDAVGVKMNIDNPNRPLRLVTSLFSTAPNQAQPLVTRQDQNGVTRITASFADETWAVFMPPRDTMQGLWDDYLFTGIAAGLHDQQSNATTLGYFLVNGTRLVVRDEVWLNAQSAISIEADFQSGSLAIDAPSGGDLSFYWPTQVSSMIENGQNLTFRYQDRLILLSLMPGTYRIMLK